MKKKELERWLYGADITPPSPAATAAALGLAVDDVADTTLLRTASRIRSLRFTVAVLHDVFPTDVDVCMWLEQPRDELSGMSPRQALLAGRSDLVEQLALEAWNDHLGAIAV